MRTWPLLLLALAGGAGGVAACSSTPPVSVFRGEALRGIEPVRGDPLKAKRGPQDPYAGARNGYFVLRTEAEWRSAWTEGQEPPEAARIDTTRSMLVMAVPDDDELVRVRVEKVVETANALHVFVRETKLGAGCVHRPGEERVLDAVVVDRIDKPARFYIEEDRAEPCGEPPALKVRCRTGDSPDWTEKVHASPGDVVDCELTAEARGRFAVVDRVMTIAELPGGSTAKLAYSKGPTRATLPIDVFGMYGVRGEVTDEGGRRATATAEIEALPPKSNELLVQLVWTNFDVSDDPDTFPRVKLRATDEATRRECHVDAQGDLCAVRRRRASTHMKLNATRGRVPLAVSYVDERAEKGPAVCVQVYFEGRRTGEACDRAHREIDERWEVGVVDTTTGALLPPAGLVWVTADAGVDADGGVDAGTSGKPITPPKPPVVKPPLRPPPPRPVE